MALIGRIERAIGSKPRLQATISGDGIDDRLGAAEETCRLVEAALIADLKRELGQRLADGDVVGSEQPRLDLQHAAIGGLGAGIIVRRAVEPPSSMSAL